MTGTAVITTSDETRASKTTVRDESSYGCHSFVFIRTVIKDTFLFEISNKHFFGEEV